MDMKFEKATSNKCEHFRGNVHVLRHIEKTGGHSGLVEKNNQYIPLIYWWAYFNEYTLQQL